MFLPGPELGPECDRQSTRLIAAHSAAVNHSRSTARRRAPCQGQKQRSGPPWESLSRRRFVFASTCAVYDVSHGSLVEDLTPTKPANLYGSCKLAVENILQAFAAQTGLSAASGRVFHLFGPSEDSRRFVPSIIIPLLQRRTAVCRNRDQVLDFLYVEDVAAAFCALLESTEVGAVNFGSGTPIRLGEFAAKIATKIGHDEGLELQTDPTQKQSVLTPDVTKLAQRIGWHPAFTLDNALDKTIEWWRAQPIT